MMIYNEVKRDLFTVDQKYYLAHCISSDCKMGAGIAVEFDKRFKMRRTLLDTCNEARLTHPTCVLKGRVFNLITKEKYWHKPTYDTFAQSLILMREMCLKSGIQNIAMPKIGCGLDGLKWPNVRDMINEVFGGTDVEILVCYVWEVMG